MCVCVFFKGGNQIPILTHRLPPSSKPSSDSLSLEPTSDANFCIEFSPPSERWGTPPPAPGAASTASGLRLGVECGSQVTLGSRWVYAGIGSTAFFWFGITYFEITPGGPGAFLLWRSRLGGPGPFEVTLGGSGVCFIEIRPAVMYKRKH